MSGKDFEIVSGMLSDSDIRSFWGNGINVFTSENGSLAFDLDKQLQYGSIDLHFRHEYKKIRLDKNDTLTYEMLKKHDYTSPFELKSGEKLLIAPGEMILTTTLETIQLSEGFAGIITGRSSIARLGVMVHCCQEYINPGHGQPIPLQLINLAPCTVELDLSIPICQLILFKLRTPATGTYKTGIRSKYSNEVGPQVSKIYEESTETREDGNPPKPKKIDFRGILSKYALPFLPSIIMLLLITPLANNYVNNNSLFDIVAAVKNMPLAPIMGVIILGLYIWIKRGNKE